LPKVLAGEEGAGSEASRREEGSAMLERLQQYATDETGLNPGADVWFWSAPVFPQEGDTYAEKGAFNAICQGTKPKPGQRVVYVDGGFDLFSSGHIEFLRQVIIAEEELGRQEGWYSKQAVQERTGKGSDYGPAFVVAGVHDDEVINSWKGVNYPIMNIYERGLCVLQCKYVNAVIFGAPFTADGTYLRSLPWGTPDAVYHGPTSFMPSKFDPYSEAKGMGIYKEIGNHDFANVNAGQIVQRIMKSRDMYEERQRVKGVKGIGEEAQRNREKLEDEQRLKESRV